MMLLPKDVGPFTLLRKLGTGAVAESYLGRLNSGGGQDVVVRRVLPYILHDSSRLASTEARVRDLVGVRHPFLVQVLDWVAVGDDRYIVEDRVDGIDLDRVLAWCRSHDQTIPHNVFLNLATQICNGLEALHGRPGRGSGADNVLHLGLRPGAVYVTRDGKVVLGGFGLTRSPTTLSHGGISAPVPTRMEYLSPEQTQTAQKLTPASDIFALGAVLYELLTTTPLFRSDSNLQTINRIRKAELTTQLLQVKNLMLGLDKVLYRALSLNPRHRYQRAFVLREDLRGLMAGYSFSTIVDDTRTFFGPLFQEGLDVVEAPATHTANAQPSDEELAAAGIGSGTPDLSGAGSSASALAATGTGVASAVAATIGSPDSHLPPPVPLPSNNDFQDDIATRV
ncbi:MAG: serine/threonine protein kinase, partial [Oligoflexia bacterium]|nr:serine/threonine protein kinase [Oligoflexia bacterium]